MYVALTISESPFIHMGLHKKNPQMFDLIITMWAKDVSAATLTAQETIK